MIKLILAGGGGKEDSRPLDELLVKLLPRDKRAIVYIPIAMESRPYKKCYQWVVSVFSPLKFTNITMWTELSEKKYTDLNDIGAIYIGGGNTFNLLKKVRDSGFVRLIKKFVYSGRIVYGGSAGAVILGKDIRTSEDRNTVGLKDTKGLNLVRNHSIWCHYDKNQDSKILEYVKASSIPVIALTERSGIFVKGQNVKVIGFEPTFLFTDRKKVSYKPDTFFKL